MRTQSLSLFAALAMVAACGPDSMAGERPVAQTIVKDESAKQRLASGRTVEKETTSDGLDDAPGDQGHDTSTGVAPTATPDVAPVAPNVDIPDAVPTSVPPADPGVVPTAVPSVVPTPVPTAVRTAVPTPVRTSTPVVSQTAAPLDPCDPSRIVELAVPVVFEATTQTCAWGTQGNGAAQDGFLKARHQRTVSLALPVGAKVCGLRISAPTQTIDYDDEFFLLLGDVVLSSSQNYNDLLGTRAGSPVFDWTKLLGKALRTTQMPYCLGAAEKLSTCVVPPSPSTGEFSLRLDDSLIRKAFDGLSASALSLSLVTTGDNDASDCRNGRMELKANVRFAPAR